MKDLRRMSNRAEVTLVSKKTLNFAYIFIEAENLNEHRVCLDVRALTLMYEYEDGDVLPKKVVPISIHTAESLLCIAKRLEEIECELYQSFDTIIWDEPETDEE